jgi:hypothetical protein
LPKGRSDRGRPSIQPATCPADAPGRRLRRGHSDNEARFARGKGGNVTMHRQQLDLTTSRRQPRSFDGNSSRVGGQVTIKSTDRSHPEERIARLRAARRTIGAYAADAGEFRPVTIAALAEIRGQGVEHLPISLFTANVDGGIRASTFATERADRTAGNGHTICGRSARAIECRWIEREAGGPSGVVGGTGIVPCCCGLGRNVGGARVRLSHGNAGVMQRRLGGVAQPRTGRATRTRIVAASPNGRAKS